MKATIRTRRASVATAAPPPSIHRLRSSTTVSTFGTVREKTDALSAPSPCPLSRRARGRWTVISRTMLGGGNKTASVSEIPTHAKVGLGDPDPRESVGLGDPDLRESIGLGDTDPRGRLRHGLLDAVTEVAWETYGRRFRRGQRPAPNSVFPTPHPALSHEGRGDIGQLSLELCLPTTSIVPTVADIRAASGDMLHESTKTELMRRMVGIADGDTGG